MKSHLVAAILPALLFAAACKKDAPHSTSSFAGVWVCDGHTDYKFTEQPTQSDRSVAATLTTTMVANGDSLEATSVRANGESTGCVTRYTLHGDTAIANPGQVCKARSKHSNGDTEDITVTVTNATATLSGPSYEENVEATFTLSIMSPNGEAKHLAGNAIASETCHRK
ncbi:MAG: hypothetical protein ABI467_24515 [Kofleriaceae bacterium]